ncbi:hypothetical protein GOV09_06390 [Candidatus Woesearchaeota archaeon]|nr:hypothetical protein [Candidatus Woesearchaeota archaeon]
MGTTSYVHRLATLLHGADTLVGGDNKSDDGGDHVIADGWPLRMDIPDVYDDPMAVRLRAAGGVNLEEMSPTEVIDYVDRHRLEALAVELRTEADQFSETRRGVNLRKIETLDIVLRHALSQVDEAREAPSFDEKYQKTNFREPFLEPPTKEREQLVQALGNVGVIVGDRDLGETYRAWHNANLLPGDQVKQTADDFFTLLLADWRANVFERMDFGIPGLDAHLADVAFDGAEFRTVNDVPYTGFSLYMGGENPDGSPKLASVFEYNTDIAKTREDFFHLVSHELVGHYVQGAVFDLMRRAGKLPSEMGMNMMASNDCLQKEGWAEQVLELMYGSHEAAMEHYRETMGEDFVNRLEVTVAAQRLHSAAKHMAVIRRRRDGYTSEQVVAEARELYAQSDSDAAKVDRWSKHPLFGDMYLSAYLIGTESMGAAIRRIGRIATARIGLGLEGPIDHESFQYLAAEVAREKQ